MVTNIHGNFIHNPEETGKDPNAFQMSSDPGVLYLNNRIFLRN